MGISEEIKRYEPTPRHLERLRKAGFSLASEALTGLGVLVTATIGLVCAGRRLGVWVAAIMAQDLQEAGGQKALGTLFAKQLAGAAGVVVLIGLVATAVAILVQAAQGKFPQSLSKELYLPMAMRGRGYRRQRTGLWAGLIGLAAAGMICGDLLRRMAETNIWDVGSLSPVIVGMWGRWLLVLTGLAVGQAVVWRWARWQEARMSYREMAEEQRMTEGTGRRQIWRRRPLRGRV